MTSLVLSVEFPSNHLIKLQTKEPFSSLTCIQKHIVNVTSLIPMKLGVNKKSRPLYRFRIEDSKILSNLSNQRQLFLWTFSCKFSLAYSPLNSDTLEKLSEVTLNCATL